MPLTEKEERMIYDLRTKIEKIELAEERSRITYPDVFEKRHKRIVAYREKISQIYQNAKKREKAQ